MPLTFRPPLGISFAVKIPATLSLILLSSFLFSCKKEDPAASASPQSDGDYFSTAPAPPAHLSRNNLANEPTEFLKSQADSAINWQPYSTAILEDAEKAQRLIFLLVGSTAFSESRLVAEALAATQAETINASYVPVLADGTLDPSLMKSCNHFAEELRQATVFPVALFLSHEGHLINHLPLNLSNREDVTKQFDRAHQIVSVIQEKSFRYLIEDSRQKNERRLERLQTSLMIAESEEETEGSGADLSRREAFLATQRIVDLYDATKRDFDYVGGIPPADLLSVLIQVAAHPAAPSRFRADVGPATSGTLDKIVRSATRDPLDNYFFAQRASPSYAVPVFVKSLVIQSNFMTVFAHSQPTPILSYAEAALFTALEQSAFTIQSPGNLEVARAAYLWSEQSLQAILTEQEYRVAEKAFELQPLGNIPRGEDIDGLFFRKNSLGLKKSPQELAEATGLPLDKSNELFASLTAKIAAERDQRLESGPRLLTETLPTLYSRAQLLQALSHSAAVRPSTAKLARIDALADSIMTDYRSPEGALLRIPHDLANRSFPAQAIDLIKAADALLTYYNFFGKPDVLPAVQALVSELLNRCLDENDLLYETPPAERIIQMPNYDNRMVFGVSSWGLGLSVLNRAASLGHQHPRLEAACAAMKDFLNDGVRKRPFVHTDYLLNFFLHEPRLVLLVPSDRAAVYRRELATPKFFSILTVSESSKADAWPSLEGNSALLLRDGEVVQSWQDPSQVAAGLESYLSKN